MKKEGALQTETGAPSFSCFHCDIGQTSKAPMMSLTELYP